MIQYTIDKDASSVTVIFPDDLLSTNSESLQQSIFGLLNSNELTSFTWQTLKLDLTAAKMIDSTGLNLIVSLIKLVRNRGGKLAISISSSNIHRTFLFTRIDTQVDLTVVE